MTQVDHNLDYKALEEQLHGVQQEEASLKAQHSELRQKHENERLTWVEDKKTPEATIMDMSTLELHQEMDRSVVRTRRTCHTDVDAKVDAVTKLQAEFEWGIKVMELVDSHSLGCNIESSTILRTRLLPGIQHMLSSVQAPPKE